ncbi:MAG TPA: 16S rRNA (cytosine(1402)-N(4))-methyltransferase RsmH [Gammaproteobacteria bacterium]|nr:16S rRNA (cytosine(1402)-N(4))-methyltransferase RsmH [Gammaproteobacteria bacterium]
MADDIRPHRPVLLAEAVDALQIKSGGIYLDGTFGRGGHAEEILSRLGEGGKLLAMDQDPQAIAAAHQKFAKDPRFEIEQKNFEHIEGFVVARNLSKQIDGVLLDIGVSSPQLDDADRGFSFLRSGPLDMRMNPQAGQSAAQWLAEVKEYDLVTVLMHFGEEKFARRIAHAIVETRQSTAIDNTLQLANIIEAAVPVRDKKKHPATKSFQAIRIYINRELEVLEHALQGALNVLSVGGRLVVISFHSLEDRMVKRFFRDMSREIQLPKEIPVMTKDIEQPYKLASKAIKPSKAELKENPRARSSVLRVLERVK